MGQLTLEPIDTEAETAEKARKTAQKIKEGQPAIVNINGKDYNKTDVIRLIRNLRTKKKKDWKKKVKTLSDILKNTKVSDFNPDASSMSWIHEDKIPRKINFPNHVTAILTDKGLLFATNSDLDRVMDKAGHQDFWKNHPELYKVKNEPYVNTGEFRKLNRTIKEINEQNLELKVESAMSTLDIIAQEADNLQDFIKQAFDEFPKLKKNKQKSIKWLTDMYKTYIKECDDVFDDDAANKFRPAVLNNESKKKLKQVPFNESKSRFKFGSFEIQNPEKFEKALQKEKYFNKNNYDVMVSSRSIRTLKNNMSNGTLHINKELGSETLDDFNYLVDKYNIKVSPKKV